MRRGTSIELLKGTSVGELCEKMPQKVNEGDKNVGPYIDYIDTGACYRGEKLKLL